MLISGGLALSLQRSWRSHAKTKDAARIDESTAERSDAQKSHFTHRGLCRSDRATPVGWARDNFVIVTSFSLTCAGKDRVTAQFKLSW